MVKSMIVLKAGGLEFLKSFSDLICYSVYMLRRLYKGRLWYQNFITRSKVVHLSRSSYEIRKEAIKSLNDKFFSLTTLKHELDEDI